MVDTKATDVATMPRDTGRQAGHPSTRAPNRRSMRDRRKVRDRSFILMAVGWVLLMPPAVRAADLPFGIGGIPVALIYLVAVWTTLIVGAAVLAGPLLASEQATGGRSERVDTAHDDETGPAASRPRC